MPSARSALCAVLAGLAIGVAGAPLELSFVAFLAPGALLVALEPKPGAPVDAQRALVLALLCGVTTNAYSMYWVAGLLHAFARFPWIAAVPVAALLWIAQSLLFVVAALGAVELMRRGASGWLVLPACLSIAGTITPAIFPWRYGVSQVPFLPYAQVAEIGSLPLLDWLVATVGCGLVDALRRPRWRAPALAATLAFVVPTLYGALRLPMVENEREAAPSLRVGVVQPNIGIWEKWNPALFVPHLRALQEATRELEARGAELVVWPETSYPFPIHRSARQDRVGALAIAGNGVRGPILTGVISTDGPIVTAAVRDEHGFFVDTIEMGTGHRFNSAVGIERGGGIAAIADKVRLLAFGEYVPFWDWLPPLQGLFARGLSPGQGSQVIEVAGTRVGVLNCYEDLLADHVRWQASYEPSFWANLTNNAWFGNTSAPHLHHMNARLRAIETRRDLIRAVNTGVSGHTRATGEDTVRTGTFERASFVADVRLLRGTTPWVRFGDFVTPLLIALLGSILITGRARRATLRAETA